MYIIKCVICGNEFQAKRPHAKYCNKCHRTAHNQYELERNRGIRQKVDNDYLEEQKRLREQWLLDEQERQERERQEHEQFMREHPTYVYDKYVEMRNKRLEEDKQPGAIRSNWYIGGVYIYAPDFEEQLKEMLIEKGLLKGEQLK